MAEFIAYGFVFGMVVGLVVFMVIIGGGSMIHCMSDCLNKLEAIKKIAQDGMRNSKDVVERSKFEQISMEVSYLINEAGSGEVK